MQTLIMTTQPTCPRCGASLIEIIYGYPSNELFEMDERNEVRLGGCVIPSPEQYFHYECSGPLVHKFVALP